MPRKPIDYSKTIIYHFVCKDGAVVDTYVGHTTEFTKRKNSHKSKCNNEKSKGHNCKIYQNIRANGGFENWTMTPLEEYPCENDIQARIREQYWMDKLRSKLNMFKAFGAETKQEYSKKYQEEHKEQIAEYRKIYNEEHKDKKKEYDKQYREENNEQIAKYKKQYHEEHKEEIAKYKKQYRKEHKIEIAELKKKQYEANKEKIKERSKKYYEENKEKKLEHWKQKFTCTCGSTCRISDKSSHFKTLKHQNHVLCKTPSD